MAPEYVFVPKRYWTPASVFTSEMSPPIDPENSPPKFSGGARVSVAAAPEFVTTPSPTRADAAMSFPIRSITPAPCVRIVPVKSEMSANFTSAPERMISPLPDTRPMTIPAVAFAKTSFPLSSSGPVPSAPAEAMRTVVPSQTSTAFVQSLAPFRTNEPAPANSRRSAPGPDIAPLNVATALDVKRVVPSPSSTAPESVVFALKRSAPGPRGVCVDWSWMSKMP